MGYFDSSMDSMLPAVLMAAAAGLHHYRVAARDERYRFEISTDGVRNETTSSRVPWQSIVAIRERLTERVAMSVLAAVMLIGGLVWAVSTGEEFGLLFAALGAFLAVSDWFEVSKTEVGPRTLSWQTGSRLRELELRAISKVRVKLSRSKYGSHLKILVNGTHGYIDVRPKDADPIPVYRAILAGIAAQR